MIKIEIPTTEFTLEQHRRLDRIISDGIINDEEMMELMRMKNPDLFKPVVRSTIDTPEMNLRPARASKRQANIVPYDRREKVIFLAITGPAVLVSLISLLVGLL